MQPELRFLRLRSGGGVESHATFQMVGALVGAGLRVKLPLPNNLPYTPPDVEARRPPRADHMVERRASRPGIQWRQLRARLAGGLVLPRHATAGFQSRPLRPPLLGLEQSFVRVQEPWPTHCC